MEKILNKNLEGVFENILLGAINKDGNKDVDLVSYTELLVEFPNDEIDNIIHNVVKRFISEYGVDIFYKKLRDSINSGISKIGIIENISSKDFYDKVYKYYTSI